LSGLQGSSSGSKTGSSRSPAKWVRRWRLLPRQLGEPEPFATENRRRQKKPSSEPFATENRTGGAKKNPATPAPAPIPPSHGAPPNAALVTGAVEALGVIL
jgi:hypothetical protein